MRLNSWIRETLHGYRWLWRAQLRWGAGPRWFAPVRFAARVVVDVAHAGLAVGLRPPPMQAAPVPARSPMSGRIAMNTQHSTPALVVFENSANDRLKATFNSWLWTSMIAATVIHFGTFAFWPELTAADLSIVRGELMTIELPPEVDIPPAPMEIARPAAPVMATTPVAEDLTIGRTNFDNNPVSELPPPPDVLSTEVSRVTFTPYTVAPSILNTGEVVRAMQREYPSTLRDSGIGGTVKVNFFVDERGQVLDTRIEEGSGYGTLDAAALAVAEVIRFSPALNRDQNVAVWVVFPVVFRVDPREE